MQVAQKSDAELQIRSHNPSVTTSKASPWSILSYSFELVNVTKTCDSSIIQLNQMSW